MGLGKTVQALALLLHRQALGPALVVAPTSVEFNWLREAEKFAPSLKFAAWRHGDRKQSAQLGRSDVPVISYDLLVRDVEVLQKTKFSTLVLDEAQSVKNATTLRWKAIHKLQADFRLGLTGTPVENHIGELWAVLAAAVPGLSCAKPTVRRASAANGRFVHGWPGIRPTAGVSARMAREGAARPLKRTQHRGRCFTIVTAWR